MNFTKEINKLEDQVEKEVSEMKALEAVMGNVQVRCGNIYFIYADDELKYVGQRKIKDIKSRLQNHFTGNGEKHGTGSQWKKFSAEREFGRRMTFKTITISPDSFRTTIEEELIKRLKPAWNSQGKTNKMR